jgi:hypothetical protein
MAYRLLRREGWLRKGCSARLPAGRSGPGLLMAQCVVTKPNTPIRSGPWISSSTPPLTAAGSNFST